MLTCYCYITVNDYASLISLFYSARFLVEWHGHGHGHGDNESTVPLFLVLLVGPSVHRFGFNTSLPILRPKL